MSIKLTSRKAKITESIFILFLIVIIFFSFFKPIQAGDGEIGLQANPLRIGDRRFYISDKNPFGGRGYENYKGGPLYPNVLKGISYISIKIFNQSTTSIWWNSITILISSTLTILTFRLTYAAGKLLFDERTGIISMIFFTFSPYTYFYALSGGITIYTLFGTSLSTYLTLKIFNHLNNNQPNNSRTLEKILLSLTLIYMSLIRPSSIIFSIVISLIMIILEITNLLKFKKPKKLLSFSIFIFVFSLVFSMHQLWDTKNYTIATINIFSFEQGTFMGVDRNVIRNKIEILLQSSEIIKNIEGFLNRFLWKFNDYFTGIIDIRDTHSPQDMALFPFLIRVSIGTTLLAPLTYFSYLGIFIFRKKILKTGLWISLFASFLSVSPSLLGVAMSRYYYMFITPYILISAMTISKIFKYKTIEELQSNEK